MKFLIFLVLVFTIISVSQQVKVNKCKNARAAFPRSVYILGCSKQPCYATENTLVYTEYLFTAKTEITKLTPTLAAVIDGVAHEIDFPPDILDACSHLLGETQCPIAAGESAVYNFEMVMPLKDYVGPVNSVITLLDQNDEIVLCFNVDYIMEPPYCE